MNAFEWDHLKLKLLHPLQWRRAKRDVATETVTFTDDLRILINGEQVSTFHREGDRVVVEWWTEPE